LKGQYALDMLCAWGSKGALNVATGLWLVQAQKAAVDQDMDSVKTLFDKAISGLRRCGLRSFEALACESFAEFALEKCDNLLGMDYMQRAHLLYAEWGALAKVRQIETNHSKLFRDVDVQEIHRSANKTRRFDIISRRISDPNMSSWWSITGESGELEDE